MSPTLLSRRMTLPPMVRRAKSTGTTLNVRARPLEGALAGAQAGR